MADEAPDLNARVAARVRELRTARGLSLDSLATRSGVSRSMISLVERGESSPTAVLLEKLASALDVTLASLFDIPPSAEPPAGPLARRKEQPEWRDPGSGYVRRNVSPPGAPQPMRIVDVRFPAGARVAFDNAARDATAIGSREAATRTSIHRATVRRGGGLADFVNQVVLVVFLALWVIARTRSCLVFGREWSRIGLEFPRAQSKPCHSWRWWAKSARACRVRDPHDR